MGIIKKRKLSFFGHVCRNKCTLMQDIIHGKMEGRRGQGRPKTAYMDNIRDWTGRNSRDIYAMRENREEWRTAVQRAMRAANVSSNDAG